MEHLIYLGKEYENNKGSNVYLNIGVTMGNYGLPSNHINNYGCVQMGRKNNPNCIMSIQYFMQRSTLRSALKEKLISVFRELDIGVNF